MAENKGYYLDIEDYYDKIHRTTWARRTAGMMAGATLGAAYGAAGGAIAAFIPYVLGALGIAGVAAIPFSAAVAGIGTSVTLFAGVVAALGMFITADVAANSASSAVGLEEKERREKLEKMKDCNAIPEMPVSTKQTDEKGPPLFSWKVAVIAAPLFAAFGALIACNPFTAALVFKEAPFASLAGNVPATIATSASVFGMFGGFLGLKSSWFTNKLTNFYYKVATGTLFGKEPQKEIAMEKPRAIEENAVQAANDITPRKSFATDVNRFSLQDLVEKNKPAQDVVLTR